MAEPTTLARGAHHVYDAVYRELARSILHEPGCSTHRIPTPIAHSGARQASMSKTLYAKNWMQKTGARTFTRRFPDIRFFTGEYDEELASSQTSHG